MVGMATIKNQRVLSEKKAAGQKYEKKQVKCHITMR